MNKYTVIYNKNSRGRRINKEFLDDLLTSHKIDYELHDVSQKSETDAIIKDAIGRSVESFCSVGGDGSLNYMVNSLIKSNHPNPVVACLPAGSGSDFIRTFGISQKIEEAISHLSTNSTYEVDVGKMSFKSNSEYFINVANIGFLADTVERSDSVPNYLSKYRYSVGFWTKIIPAQPLKMSLVLDGKKYEDFVFNVCICNGQYFGGGKNISPKSSLQDGLFNVQIFAVNKLTAMKIFFKANKGLHLNESGVINKKASNIQVLTTHPIEMDGDFITTNKSEFSIENKKIRFKI